MRIKRFTTLERNIEEKKELDLRKFGGKVTLGNTEDF